MEQYLLNLGGSPSSFSSICTMSQNFTSFQSNVAAMSVKVIEDALQKYGVISNDGWANIAGYSQDFFVDKDNPRIEVTITEVEDGNS